MVALTMLLISTIIPYFIRVILVSMFFTCSSHLERSKMHTSFLIIFLLEMYLILILFLVHHVLPLPIKNKDFANPTALHLLCQIMASPISLLRKFICSHFPSDMSLNWDVQNLINILNWGVIGYHVYCRENQNHSRG